MPDLVFYAVGGVGCAYMLVFIVIYCFPYAVPFDETSMNYSSLIAGGLTLFIAGWWAWVGGRGYVGPTVLMGEERRRSVDAE